MKNHAIGITGLGIMTAVGKGKEAFFSALMEGKHNFRIMQREGRQYDDKDTGRTAFIGAELDEFDAPENLPKKELRVASLTALAAVVAVEEAWREANLNQVDPRRIGLVIGGTNIQQRELVQTYNKYQERGSFLPPTYGLTFLDTDICGLCSEYFGIKGLVHTFGASSASGQAAVIQAIEAVRSGQVDVCIAVGALMDISYWECLGFRSLGAMGSKNYAASPELACRPFDRNRDGFIFGESCGAIVVEKVDRAAANTNAFSRVGLNPYCLVSGWATLMDGFRVPHLGMGGIVGVIQKFLVTSGISPKEIAYVNPHGTGSLYDETELKALAECGLKHAAINATKSITGHGLTSAGAVEIIATALQMRASRLHGTRNLDNPVDSSFNWVEPQGRAGSIFQALTLSYGFGGIHTALGLRSA